VASFPFTEGEGAIASVGDVIDGRGEREFGCPGRLV
jgi:hypothetical protein